MRSKLAALALAVLMTFPHLPALASDAPDPLGILRGMAAAYEKVDDYTATFLKRERVKGKLLPEETVSLSFMKPFAVRMAWRKGPHEGRQAVYVRGKNGGKVIGRDSGFLGFLKVKMDPKGSLAMRGNRHPITDVGIGRLIDFITADVARGIKNNELKLAYIGEEPVFGRAAHHVQTEYPPQEKGYYARRMEIWVDRELGLPTKVEVYGYRDELLEAYGYKDVKINPGLTEEDFVIK